MEVLLAVVGDAALDSSRIKKVGNQDRRLKSGSHRIKMEGPSREAEYALRRPVAAKHMQQVRRRATGPAPDYCDSRRQSLARRGAWDVLFAIVVEQISDV